MLKSLDSNIFPLHIEKKCAFLSYTNCQSYKTCHMFQSWIDLPSSPTAAVPKFFSALVRVPQVEKTKLAHPQVSCEKAF